jgi:hypothetical protein
MKQLLNNDSMKKTILSVCLSLLCVMTGSAADELVSEPSFWSFDQYDAGRTFQSLTNFRGMYLRATSARTLTVESNALSGTFSDGSQWNVLNVGTNVAGPVFDTNGMTASVAPQSKKTDCCFAIHTAVPGTLYVIMMCSQNNADRYMYLKFNGTEVQHVVSTKTPTEMKYKASAGGVYYFGSNVKSYLVAARFVPDVEEYSLLAPSDCFSFSSPLNLDLTNSDLRAYIADEVQDGNVAMKRVYAVPGQTGVVMRGTAGKTYNIRVMKTATPIGKNLLRPAMTIQKVKAEEAEVTSASYHHNSDEFAAELVRRWQEYYQERPGQGTRVNAGGVKIIFSDSQTHSRGVENFRTSGIVDPMRLPKDAFFVHQAMWDGWVDDLKPHTYICGHWNYESGQTIPRIYVVSTSPAVELCLPDETVLQPTRKDGDFLFIFDKVPFTAGTLTAIGYDGQHQEQSRHTLQTTGEPARLVLTAMQHPTGWKADGADVALVDVEIVDAEGRRCPLDNRDVTFSLDGPAQWLGGVAHGSTQPIGARWTNDNYAFSTTLPVQSGINRVMLRSLAEAGSVTLTASAEGLSPVSIDLTTLPVETVNGLSTFAPVDGLKPVLDRGETPSTPSFDQQLTGVPVKSAKTGSGANPEQCYDDNERTTWSSGNTLSSSWIEFTFDEAVQLKEIAAKMGGFRTTSYPIAVYAGDTEVWRGYTPKTLGYVRMKLSEAPASQTYRIKMLNASTTGDAFGEIVELNGSTAASSSGNYVLSITEIEFLK